MVMMEQEQQEGAASEGRWHEDGVGVRLLLAENVVEKVLDDPELRLFSS